MADTSRVQLYGMPEATYGVVAPTALKTARFTGESLKFNVNTTQSKEIRQDRQITDIIQVGAEANGGFNFELSYAAHDQYLEGALMSAFSTPINFSGATVSANAADKSIGFSASNTPAVVPGQWVRVSGFAQAVNNGYFKVLTYAANKITFDTTVVMVNEAAGPTIVIKGSMIRNGVTRKSYTLEKAFTDITQFISYRGMVVSNMNLNITANEIVTGDFGFMGKNAVISATTCGTGSAVVAPTNPVMNAVSNVAAILENNAAINGTFAKSLQIAINNNLRGKPGIGVLGNTDVGLGDCVVTGKLSVYFNDATMYTKYLNNTATSLSTRFVDALGNAYIITLPQVEFTDANPAAGGSNQDVMLELGYQATMHPTLGCTMQIDKIDL